jgi:WD40 repeat protein
MTNSQQVTPYKVGGTLELTDIYVVRPADEELYQGLKAGEFCAVLNSRQQGKSSLAIHTWAKLKQDNIACIVIDLMKVVEKDITADQFYSGICQNLVSNFKLSINRRQWWRERNDLSSLQRFSEFIEEVLLAEVRQPVVICFDEINTVIKLPFKDDFFKLIRTCYNQRAQNSDYKRLTFALFGVAAPWDLISDNTQTPFNIGREIELHGFVGDDATVATLAQGFSGKIIESPAEMIKAILCWTGGQPFLTQRLCQLVANAETIPKNKLQEWVAKFVKTRIIDRWGADDPQEHFKTIRERLLTEDARIVRRLGIYRQILQEGAVAADKSQEQMDLRLTGLVVKQEDKLVAYNPIYQEVFNLSWVEGQLAELRPYNATMQEWIKSGRKPEYLLRGQDLERVMEWKQGKNLSPEDTEYIDTSLLESLKEYKENVAEIRKIAKDFAKIDPLAEQAIQKFKNGKGEIEALLLAMEAGKALYTYVRDNCPISEYPTIKPLSSLYFILNQIKERNQIRHQSSVWSVSFSPDGQYLATGSLDGTARLWDLQGNQVAEFSGHQSSVLSVSFSPDGQYLATGSDDRTARLWDRKGNQVAEFSGHQGWVMSVSFSPDGQYLATGSSDSTARLWDLNHLPNPPLLRGGNGGVVFSGHQDSVWSVSFSPNGQYLATASHDRTARLWDMQGNQVAEFSGHQGWVWSVSFSADGQYLATGSSDSTARLWDMQGNQVAEFSGHQDSVRSVSFSLNGQYLATGSVDRTARLWDRKGNQLVEFSGHQFSVTSVSFSPDGQYLATGSSDSTARLWDLNGNQVAEFSGHQGWVWSVSFSPDGQYLATGSRDKTARLWDRKGKQVAEFSGHQGWVRSVSVSPDSQYLATGSDERTARLWDLNGNQVAEFSGHQDSVTSVSFSPDGQYLATASRDRTARLWDLNGNQVAEFSGHQSSVTSVSFSPDGQYLATVSDDRTARLWDLQGNQVAEFSGHQDRINSVSFSPDGQYLATVSDDQTARLWDLNGNQLAKFSGHQKSVRSVSFSADGQYLATGSDDGTARLWDLQGNQLAEFSGHQDWVRSVSFSPDGQYLATGSLDRTARLWDLQGNQLAKFSGHQDSVNSVSFSPDGQYLATGSSDRTARLWRVESLAELLARGYDWLQDYLATHPEAAARLKGR